ncbi:retrovirus-related pol polyprotein from transposon TNT 1-94 [Tanacetum coccineum]|uniref:Retrovirus-related pol polyprotein from transposon TNT 1-94 n=1 Tax=Tanacetum coccineum TaxID=301880 RepID=A0ABQ4WAS1_9ASTR
MSNTNNNLQTQTSNALHNAIMEAGGKDRPPILAPGNYVQWKSRIKRYIDTKPNNELIHYCLQNPPYKFKWTKRTVPVTATVADDDEMSKEKEIDKLMALISLSFKKIYKPTNNNLRTSSNTSSVNQDNSSRINRGTGYDNQRVVNIAWARENVEVTPDAADNSGPIFDAEPLQKVQNDDDTYNVFDNDQEHPKRPESVNEPYPVEHDEHNIIIDSLDMSYDREHDDQDDTDDLAKECDLLTSLIEKLKCEINDSKNRNKFFESSNKALVDKLKGKIEDFKTKNKSLESLNNNFKEANNELSKTNQLMFKDLKKFQAELDRYHDVNYASKVAIDCAKAKGDLITDKNDKAFKENQSNIILKEREQYFEIQDLKAQLQDKGIAISELKKLIEKMKGKSVETKYTWTHFLRSKDETLDVLIDFLRLIQRGLHAQGIEHQTSTARTPEQNGVVKRRNRTLVEADRTMLSASKVTLFFWAEAIATSMEQKTSKFMSKSFAVTATDAPNQRQQQHTTPSTSTTVAGETPPLNIQTTLETTSQKPTQVPTVTANKNIIQA